MKIGLVGNPNVGKSTIFNGLTNMHQHTGNWTGKTVEKAVGYKKYNGVKYEFIDLPGTYSLFAHSKEEEVTRDFIYFNDYDALVIVCDASALERNLNLVIEVLQITNKAMLCVNLMDEARKKKINIDLNKLEELLGIPVVGITAKKKSDINKLLDCLNSIKGKSFLKLNYDEFLKKEIDKFTKYIPNDVNKDDVILRFLENDKHFIKSFDLKHKTNLLNNLEMNKLKEDLFKKSIFSVGDIETIVMETINEKAALISKEIIVFNDKNYMKYQNYFDKILTSKITAIPIMLLLLFLVLWITISLSNYPSDFLYNLFFNHEDDLFNFFNSFLPFSFANFLIYGIYRITAWVVAVMLPPMIIFFPLFTFLEDFGFLPRIAFNLDGAFEKCSSCGKQSLTMAMGVGCNAVGVLGSRIIDSKKERLISILTNCFIPCNGRFPLIISMITMFLTTNNIFKPVYLAFFILFAIFMTFIVSKILSKTILKGEGTLFTLELPSYRRPQIIKTLVYSLYNRVWFILKKAIFASIPAGCIIWFLSNTYIDGLSILKILSNFFDPLGRFFGLDGVILLAFILGLPANEIVIPIMIMGYMQLNVIEDISNMNVLKTLFINNGWTSLTAICVIIFSLFHFPCLTTIMTIKKEAIKWKWVMYSIIVPLIIGAFLCFIIYHLGRYFL